MVMLILMCRYELFPIMRLSKKTTMANGSTYPVPQKVTQSVRTVLTIWCYLNARGLHDWFVKIVPDVSTMLKETQDNWY